MQLIIEMTINGVMLATSMMLVGLGFTLLHSILRVVNLAHGELYMFAAMLVWYFMSAFHFNPKHRVGKRFQNNPFNLNFFFFSHEKLSAVSYQLSTN